MDVGDEVMVVAAVMIVNPNLFWFSPKAWASSSLIDINLFYFLNPLGLANLCLVHLQHLMSGDRMGFLNTLK